MNNSIVACVVLLTLCACGGGSMTETDGGGGGGAAVGGSGGGTGTGGGGGTVPVAPETTITQRPMAPVGAQAEATFAFSCDQASCTFECAYDTDAFSACSSPSSKVGASNGAHSFRVRASASGLTDATPAEAMFTVDAVAPTITLPTKPASQTNVTASQFAFSCSETGCTYECSLDDAGFAACPEMAAFDALSAGAHSLDVRAKDAVGNTGASVTHSWSLTFGWRTVALNQTTACAVSGDRKLYCWGTDSSGQLGQGTQVLVNAAPSARPLRVGTDTDWDTLVVGQSTFCATKTGGTSACWGANYSHQFVQPDAGTSNPYSSPLPVSFDHSRTVFGSSHACSIDGAGALRCWGYSDDGNIGDGDINYHEVPSPLRVGTATWKRVSLSDHTCGIQSDGSLWCFGVNESGECGQDPVTEAIATPTRVGMATDWADVSAGSAFTCALKTNGELYCFGGNWSGQLGDGTTTQSFVPVRAGGTATFKSVIASANSTCAIRSDDVAVCWGSNEYGELGSTVSALQTGVPQVVSVSKATKRLAGNASTHCAILSDDSLECWGENVNGNGLLGRGVLGIEPQMTLIDTGYRSITTTSNWAYGLAIGGCGIKLNGSLVCWGVGRHLGQATTQASFTPLQVGTSTDWTVVETAVESTPIAGNGSGNEAIGHTCGIRAGELLCWGANSRGQLGIGSTTAASVPTAVQGPVGETWRAVALSAFNTCAITVSGKLYCWGDNSAGQLVNGGNLQATTPQQIGSLTTWAEVSLYGSRVTALRTDHTMWIWGLGIGGTVTQFDSGTSWASGKSGSNYSCGVRTNGTMACRTLALAVDEVTLVNDAASLYDLDRGNCYRRQSGAIACVVNYGSGWVPATFPVPPAGNDWEDLELAERLQCALKPNGDRYCSGLRTAGSLGDGFDARVPAPVLLP